MDSDRESTADSEWAGCFEQQMVKIILYGEEIVNKQVTLSGKSGRVYLPLGWLGKRVKIVRID